MMILKSNMYIILCLFILLLSGCASASIHRDEAGVVTKVSTRGTIEAKISQEEVYVNSKPDLLKDVINIQGVRAK